MAQVVTITSQGQLTIPQSVRERFGITGSTKAILKVEGHTIVVEPKHDFWALGGAAKSKVKLTDAQLKRARKSFEKEWPRHL